MDTWHRDLILDSSIDYYEYVYKMMQIDKIVYPQYFKNIEESEEVIKEIKEVKKKKKHNASKKHKTHHKTSHSKMIEV